MIGFLQGRAGGKISMMRVATMIVVSTIMSVWVAQNVVAMIKGCGFISMGQNEMMLIALTLGAKAAQLFGEVKVNGNGNGSLPTTTDIPSDKGQ
jgi:phosphatidylserine decarboxylase